MNINLTQLEELRNALKRHMAGSASFIITLSAHNAHHSSLCAGCHNCCCGTCFTNCLGNCTGGGHASR